MRGHVESLLLTDPWKFWGNDPVVWCLDRPLLRSGIARWYRALRLHLWEPGFESLVGTVAQKYKQASPLGGALLLTRLRHPMLSHNWWRNKYQTWKAKSKKNVPRASVIVSDWLYHRRNNSWHHTQYTRYRYPWQTPLAGIGHTDPGGPFYNVHLGVNSCPEPATGFNRIRRKSAWVGENEAQKVDQHYRY